MNLSRALAKCMVVLGLWLPAAGWAVSNELQKAETAFAGQMEKIGFETEAQREVLLGAYSKRLSSLEAAEQRQGNIAGVLALREARARALAQRGPDPEGTAPPAVLAAPAKDFATQWARLTETHLRRQLDMTSKFDAFLRARLSSLTKEGKIAEARGFLQRQESLAAELARLRAAMPVVVPPSAVPTGPGGRPVAPQTPEEVEKAMKKAGLTLWVYGSAWREREWDSIATERADQAYVLRPVKFSAGNHHKLVIGKRPLGEGDELRVEVAGLRSLDLVNPDSVRECVEYKPANREEYTRIHLRRTGAGVEVTFNDIPQTDPGLHVIPPEDREAFLKGRHQVVLGFRGPDPLRIRSFDFRLGNSRR